MNSAHHKIVRSHLHRTPAFTLVELLVVLTITAVLFGILLPSISKARHEALKLSCLSNQRQIAAAIANYASSYKNSVPTNCHNPNLVNNPRGPFRSVGGASAFYSMEASSGTMRFDKGYSGVDDFNWTGLGLIWATEFVPFDRTAARVFWCPAESIGRFGGSVTGFGTGPGFYWSQYSTKRWQSIGDLASTISVGYAYRGIGAVTGTGINSNSYRIDGLAKFVSGVDLCFSVLGEPTAANFAPFPRYSHYYPMPYTGFNRMYYDGHAKWMQDPNIIWKSRVPSGNTNYSNVYQNTWGLYDITN
jgi:prepilin-type N-terminal cleavage/methylation domain-containing protein